VHNTDKDIPGLGVALLDVALERFRERLPAGLVVRLRVVLALEGVKFRLLLRLSPCTISPARLFTIII